MVALLADAGLTAQRALCAKPVPCGFELIAWKRLQLTADEQCRGYFDAPFFPFRGAQHGDLVEVTSMFEVEDRVGPGRGKGPAFKGFVDQDQHPQRGVLLQKESIRGPSTSR